MTLIKNTTEVKSHVNINLNFDWESIDPFVKQAERQYIKSVIGKKLYDAWSSVDPIPEYQKEVYDLFVEASANLSMLKYIPQGNVVVSDNGIQNKDRKSTRLNSSHVKISYA